MAEDLESGKSAPLRMARGQQSYNGLQVISGKVMEECNRDLRWPQCMTTYKNMFKDATIAPALAIMEMNISKVKWTVKVPEGKEAKLESKAKFLRQVMDDMDVSFEDFIKSVATFNRFGFGINEKVYRRRLRSKGSKFNDGLIGLANMPIIAQDTIATWEFDDSGRKITGIRQWKNYPRGVTNNGVAEVGASPVMIPREKFLLFRADPIKDNPEGTSPLNGVYVAWRFKTELEKFESMGISQDLRGLKVLKIPSVYMSEDANDDQKATYDMFAKGIAALHKGEQSALIIPSDVDESKTPLFDFKLESVMGQSSYDVDAIIGRYRKEIITGLLCQQLILGQDGSGSFALSESLEGATDTVIDARLREIKNQLNHDLIPQIFELNGWDLEDLPYFDYESVKDASLDDYSKAVQRMASVGGLALTAEAINHNHSKLGIPTPFDDTNISVDEVRKITTPDTSKSGEGMSTGSGNGTSNSAAGRDNSAANKEN